MQAENADSAGLTRFPIRPATFARSAAHAQYSSGERTGAGARGRAGRIHVYIYRDSASVESTRGGSLTLAPIITDACCAQEESKKHIEERGQEQVLSRSIHRPPKAQVFSPPSSPDISVIYSILLINIPSCRIRENIYIYLSIYLSIVTVLPLSTQVGARSRSPQ